MREYETRAKLEKTFNPSGWHAVSYCFALISIPRGVWAKTEVNNICNSPNNVDICYFHRKRKRRLWVAPRMMIINGHFRCTSAIKFRQAYTSIILWRIYILSFCHSVGLSYKSEKSAKKGENGKADYSMNTAAIYMKYSS